MVKRTDRLNSLLKEVIAEVVMKEVRNPKMSGLVTIKEVEITKDLQHAKVFVSIFGSEAEKKKTLKALQSAAGFISVQTAKKVVMKYFPTLSFHLDSTLDEEIKIHNLLEEIYEEQSHRSSSSDRS